MRFCSRARVESILLRVHLVLIGPPGTHEIFVKSISEWPDEVLKAPQSVQQLALPGTLWEWGWKCITSFPTGSLQCTQYPRFKRCCRARSLTHSIKWTPLAPFSTSCAKHHSISLSFLSSFLHHCAVFWISTESSWGPSKPVFLEKMQPELWMLLLQFGCLQCEPYYQPTGSGKHRARILTGPGSWATEVLRQLSPVYSRLWRQAAKIPSQQSSPHLLPIRQKKFHRP